MKFAVIKTGGKQYLVHEGNEIFVDQVGKKQGEKIDLETLLIADDEGKEFELGQPQSKVKVTAEVIENLKGDKVRVARFKSKTRYRKVKGFRAMLSKLKIIKI